jgi:hypothetical protein
MDSTFVRQFGMAVQSDILRQAAYDRQASSSAYEDRFLGRLSRRIARIRFGRGLPYTEHSLT